MKGSIRVTFTFRKMLKSHKFNYFTEKMEIWKKKGFEDMKTFLVELLVQVWGFLQKRFWHSIPSGF